MFKIVGEGKYNLLLISPFIVFIGGCAKPLIALCWSLSRLALVPNVQRYCFSPVHLDSAILEKSESHFTLSHPGHANDYYKQFLQQGL